MESHYTEPTTAYWQQIINANNVKRPSPPWQFGCPVELPDSRFLLLPIRRLHTNPDHAVASLLVNAASLEVVDALSSMLVEKLKPYLPDVIVGLPTLGHALCPGVARGLGHSRYVVCDPTWQPSSPPDTRQPLGYSQKFWYQESLSTPVSSITSPGLGQKRLWIDPHQLPLLADCRVAIIDDAVSSGTTMLAAWQLLESLGVNIVACGVAMSQGTKWRDLLGEDRTKSVVAVFDSPLLEAVPDGWSYRT